MPRSRAFALLLLVVFAGGGLATFLVSRSAAGPSEPAFRRDGHLEFVDAGTREPIVRIDIEVADEPVEQAQGLKYRRRMAEDQGMLFVFPTERPQSFWMQDTHIPLDIVYVSEGLRIVSIAADTEPFSERPIPSGRPARYVVEVNAGFCARHGIAVGDYIRSGPE
jgi:uncharacterized membrane protein (UPF0127 family)